MLKSNLPMLLILSPVGLDHLLGALMGMLLHHHITAIAYARGLEPQLCQMNSLFMRGRLNFSHLCSNAHVYHGAW